MKLYLIRHAQSANNAVWNGSDHGDDRTPDPEITELLTQLEQYVDALRTKRDAMRERLPTVLNALRAGAPAAGSDLRNGELDEARVVEIGAV